MKLHVLTLGLLVGACSSDNAQTTRQVASDPPPNGASVFLRERPHRVLPNRVDVDVVAHGVTSLHGVAFRLTWEPGALGFVRAEHGARWSKASLSLATEPTPGQLLVAWAEKGESGLDASGRGEMVLGSISFESRTHNGTPLSFKAERCTLVDKKGAPVSVTWVGGNLRPTL